MIALNRFLYKVNYRLSRVPLFVHWAVKIKNQANIIIGLSHSDGASIDTNGEKVLAVYAAKHVDSFVDVGANKGEWTKCFTDGLQKTGFGICVEPGVVSESDLLTTVDSIKTAEIEVVPVALGDVDGELDYWEHTNSVYSSALKPSDMSGVVYRKIQVKRLDTLLVERNWTHIGFLKIDVEGIDFKVIRGCGNYLDNGNIKIIQFEYGYGWMLAGETLSAASQFLHERNYNLFFARSDGLYSFDVEKIGGDFFWFANFVALHHDVVHEFVDLIKK